MHLKNYSIIRNESKIELSPAYDLLNSTIILKGDVEEIALPIKGKKKKLNLNVLINYFGMQHCQLPDKIIDETLDTIKKAIPKWKELINISFLSQEMKDKYTGLLDNRLKNLNL
jgi:serine/threonine-protein kinase HipA